MTIEDELRNNSKDFTIQLFVDVWQLTPEKDWLWKARIYAGKNRVGKAPTKEMAIKDATEAAKNLIDDLTKTALA